MTGKNKQTRLRLLAEQMLSLFVVVLMLASAAVGSGTLFGHAVGGERDVETQALPAALTGAALETLGFGGRTLEPIDSGSWRVMETDGTEAGTILSSLPYAHDVTGFAGEVPVFVAVGTDGKIIAVSAAENAETPDFFDRVVNSGLMESWNGLTLEAAAAKEVDAVTGATFSSRAVVANVQAVASHYASAQSRSAFASLGTPAIGWTKTLLVLLVLILGVVAAFRFRGNVAVRTVVLLLNVVVTGVFCGQFISLSMLLGWVQNGFNAVTVLPALAMLLLTVVLSLFGRKNHHCTWVCPYGSLQELAWRLPLPKLKVGRRYYAVVRRVRFAVLMVLLLLAWMGVALDAMYPYEPFVAFIYESASPAVFALAATFVLLSIFVPKVWCHALCPVGELLSLAYDDGLKGSHREGEQRETKNNDNDE